MATVSELRANHQLILMNLMAGTVFQVERLPRKPGDYRKGFHLIQLHVASPCPVFLAHELPCGLHECSCKAWTDDRTCEHTDLLTAAGLFEEPLRREDPHRDGFPEDDLIEIEGDDVAVRRHGGWHDHPRFRPVLGAGARAAAAREFLLGGAVEDGERRRPRLRHTWQTKGISPSSYE